MTQLLVLNSWAKKKGLGAEIWHVYLINFGLQLPQSAACGINHCHRSFEAVDWTVLLGLKAEIKTQNSRPKPPTQSHGKCFVKRLV